MHLEKYPHIWSSLTKRHGKYIDEPAKKITFNVSESGLENSTYTFNQIQFENF